MLFRLPAPILIVTVDANPLSPVLPVRGYKVAFALELLLRIIREKVTLLVLTTSSNVRERFPELRSKSNESRSGGVVSGMKVVTCLAVSLSTGITGKF